MRTNVRRWIKKAFILGLLLSLTVAAQGREFTNLKGQKMEAEPVGMAAGKVIFEKADGKKFSYALNELIPADRTFLKEWAKTAKRQDSPLKVTEAKSVLVGKRRDTSVGAAKSSEVSRAFEVVLKNGATELIDGLIVCYTLFPMRTDRNAKGRKNSREPQSGKIRLEAIPKGGRTIFRTKPVVLNSMNLSTGAGRIRWDESLSDANFHFFFADQLVASHYVGDFKDEGTPRPEDVEADSDNDS